MILLQNSIIKLEYDPATDILQVRYPDLQRLHLSEIRHSLKIMVETIRNYDVRRLLLDASQTSMDVTDDENRNLTLELAAELSKTRLLKVARVHPIEYTKESRAQRNIDVARQSGLMPYELESFSDRIEAIAWLRL
jgi:hypothetical protein